MSVLALGVKRDDHPGAPPPPAVPITTRIYFQGKILSTVKKLNKDDANRYLENYFPVANSGSSEAGPAAARFLEAVPAVTTPTPARTVHLAVTGAPFRRDPRGWWCADEDTG